LQFEEGAINMTEGDEMIFISFDKIFGNKFEIKEALEEVKRANDRVKNFRENMTELLNPEEMDFALTALEQMGETHEKMLQSLVAVIDEEITTFNQELRDWKMDEKKEAK
jgi:hypothetical protein